MVAARRLAPSRNAVATIAPMRLRRLRLRTDASIPEVDLAMGCLQAVLLYRHKLIVAEQPVPRIGLFWPLFAGFVFDLRLSAEGNRPCAFILPVETRRPWRRFARG